MDLSADQLVVFATVADEGSVTAAARRLNVTQPAVSSRLRGLQLLAGRQLYRRTPRGIELTEAGEALLPHARAVSRALARGQQVITSPVVAELRTAIALSEAAIPRVVPLIVAESLRPPALNVRIIPCDAATAVQTVLTGAADLAVSVALPDPAADDLMRRPVASEPIVLVEAEPGRASRLADLVDMTILWQAVGSGVRATAERALEVAGVWPAASIEVGSSAGVIAAVAAGQGAGFLTRSYVAEHVRTGQVKATELDAPDLHARFELIAGTIDHLPFASRRIADALRQTTIPSTAPTIGEPPKNPAAVSS
jgi:DNA-binding transcriptional LysR family regulator